MYDSEYDEYDVDGIGRQGSDDAMLDPMAMVQDALDYGMRQLGVHAGDAQSQPSFADGGVVPTGQAAMQPQGNPNAINPRAAMEYLAGAGAVSPEIVQALEQRVDPQGQMDPTQRAMTAISVAPTPEARFGLLQHYRTRYNAHAAAAKAAMKRGDAGEVARQATMAMDNVPDGQSTQFAPSAGGLAMFSRPLSGGAPQQGEPTPEPGMEETEQSFDDGGYVEDEEEDPVEVINDEGNPPEPVTSPDDAIPEEAPAPNEPVAPVVPDAPQEEVPQSQSMTGPVPASIMPQQSDLTPQELIKALDEGFDAKLRQPRQEFADIVGQAPRNLRTLADMAGSKLTAAGGAVADYVQRKWDATAPKPTPTGYDEAVVRPPETAARPAAPAAQPAPRAAALPPQQPRQIPTAGIPQLAGAGGVTAMATGRALPQIRYGGAPQQAQGVVPTAQQAPAQQAPAQQAPAPQAQAQPGGVWRPSMRQVMSARSMAPGNMGRSGELGLRGLYPGGKLPPWDDGFYIPTNEQMDAGFARPGTREWREAGRRPAMSHRMKDQTGKSGGIFVPNDGGVVQNPASREGALEQARRAYGVGGRKTPRTVFTDAQPGDDLTQPSYDEWKRAQDQARAEKDAEHGGLPSSKTPVWERGLSPTTQRYLNEAKSLFPRTSEEGMRNAYAVQGAAAERADAAKHRLEMEKTSRAARSDERRERIAQDAQTKRAQIAADAEAGREKRQAARLAATAEENEKNRASKERMGQVNNWVKTQIANRGQTQRAIDSLLKAEPNLQRDPATLGLRLKAIFPRLNNDELQEAGRAALDYFKFGGSGPGAPAATGGVVPTTDADTRSAEQALKHNVRPGQTVPIVGNDGKTYIFDVLEGGRLRKRGLAPGQ